MAGILKTSFTLNLNVLQYIGLYPSRRFRFLHKMFAYILYIVAVLPGCVLGCLNMFLEGTLERDDYNDFATAALILLAPKWFLCLINSDNLQKYVTYFDERFAIAMNETQNNIIETCIKISQRNSIIFFSTSCIGVLGFFIKWYLEGYRSHLPTNVWIPFTCETQPLLYFCVYAVLVAGSMYATVACGTIDPLVPGLLCHISGQLQVLKENLQHLDSYVDEVNEAKNRISRDIIISERIKQSILHYRDISHCVGEFEKYFSAMVFSQFMESVVAIGLISIQVTKTGELNAYSIFMFACLCIVLFQVYFYCYYGTTVLEENSTVPTAIYTTKWYNYNSETRKVLLIFMQRSQKPMIVTSLSILDLSLDTFITILKRSYSLIAVLKTYY